MTEPYRFSLLAFLGVMGVFLGSLSLYVGTHWESMPAPRITGSVSFNEKTGWLRKALRQNPTVDIVIAGSSMGVNNIDGEELAKVAGTRAILNISSWGLNVADSCHLLSALEDAVHPKLVILPVFFGDFRPDRIRDIDLKTFKDGVFGGNLLTAYARNMDLIYYYDTYTGQASELGQKRRSYFSLHFDAFGGVPLSDDHFDYSADRWDSFRDDSIAALQVDPTSIADLKATLEDLKAGGIAAIVVVCPMRQVAEHKLAAEAESRLWSGVRKIVEDARGRFVDLGNRDDFADALFVDSYHLNVDGARKVSDCLAPYLR